MWLCTFLGRNGNKVYFFIEAPALVLCVWGWGGGRWGGWADVGRDWRWDGAAVPQVLPLGFMVLLLAEPHSFCLGRTPGWAHVGFWR